MPLRRQFVSLVLLAVLLVVASSTMYGLEPVRSMGSASPAGSVRGAALSPDEQYLYLAGVQDFAVWKFEVATGKVVAIASLAALNPGAYGKSVFVTADGHVWTPGTVPELYRFDADLNLVQQFDLRPFGIQNPEGTVVTADGTIIVTDRRGNVGLYAFRLANGTLTPVATFGQNGYVKLGSDVRQPAIAKDGSILVGDYGGDTIYKVDAKTGAVTVFATVDDPYHIAVDGDGNVYVVQYSHTVALTVLDSAGKVLATYTPAQLGLETEASGVAVTADGRYLFVVDQRPSSTGGVARMYDTTK